MKLIQKIKKKITQFYNNPISGFIAKIIQRRVLKKYFQSFIHSSIIHNSQEVEANKISTLGEQILKWYYIFKMEYYTALKRKEIQDMLLHRWTLKTLC